MEKKLNLVYYGLTIRSSNQVITISDDFMVHLYRIYIENSRQQPFYLNKYDICL